MATNLISRYERSEILLRHTHSFHRIHVVCRFEHVFEIARLTGGIRSNARSTVGIKYAYLLFFNQRPCISCPPCSSCSAYSMNILSHINRGIIADDVRDMADVDSTRNQVRAYQSSKNIPKSVECIINRHSSN